jgi:hypothetical protein
VSHCRKIKEKIMNELSYPIGKFKMEEALTMPRRKALIKEIEEAPAAMRSVVRNLSDKQLDTPYRPDGWTVRQVVHHVPDSHLNAYIRFKWALTENEPAIKAYNEKAWAELTEAKTAPVEMSLNLLEAVHARWIALLNHLTEKDFERKLIHPENGPMTLDRMLCLYAWHGKHHVAHITELRKRQGW